MEMTALLLTEQKMHALGMYFLFYRQLKSVLTACPPFY